MDCVSHLLYYEGFKGWRETRDRLTSNRAVETPAIYPKGSPKPMRLRSVSGHLQQDLQMVQAATAVVAVSCGGGRALGEESQVHVANGEKHDDRHLVLLGTRYTYTNTHLHFKGKKQKTSVRTCVYWLFVFLLAAVMLTLLLSQITQITLHSLFPLYVIQVSFCQMYCTSTWCGISGCILHLAHGKQLHLMPVLWKPTGDRGHLLKCKNPIKNTCRQETQLSKQGDESPLAFNCQDACLYRECS